MDFPVYKASVVYYKNILKIIEKVNDYSLKDQTKRAALSVALNIAEGSAVKSDKEFARYLEKSLGSLNETVACLQIMAEINLISGKIYNIMLEQSENIARQLGGFKKRLTF
ncbi:MAG: four helix bundle protein [Patescibacteria group bacterium]|nr:four helix bundle protein [Patescibacteria group bacterium]